MKRFTRYFLNGLVLLVPVVVTIYVVYIVFVKIDNLFKFPIPGVGFILTILTITAIGFIGSNILTRKLVRIIDMLFSRLPFIKMIYTSLKDLVDAFVGDKRSFNKPVSVTLMPGSNVQVVGFITNESLNNLGFLDSVAVYLPQSYNFAGNLIIVPKQQVTLINADSGEVMKFIVSGGVSGSKA